MAEGRKISKTLNLLGFFCPIPMHETRAALSSLEEGGILEVICDDPETLRDIPLLCKRMGREMLEISESSGEYVFFISNTSDNRLKGEGRDE